jgi:hypothetical protein
MMDTKKDQSRSHIEDDVTNPSPAGLAQLTPATGVDALLLLVNRWMAEPEIDDELDGNLEAALNENRRQSADNTSLDADVILAAQAATFNASGCQVEVVTLNVGHLSRYGISAKPWDQVP